MTDEGRGELRGAVNAFGLLGRPINRRVLVELAHEGGRVDIRTLAAAVTESGTARADAVPVDATDADEVLIELFHEHLPRLADAGWIAYDHDGATARCRLRTDVVRSALRVASGELEVVRAMLAEPTG